MEMTGQNHCLGIIETKGLAPALEAADAMLKLGGVTLEAIYFIGAGEVSVVVCGDIGPVQTAVQCGAESAERKGRVLSRNVIPRCHKDLVSLLEKLKNTMLQRKEVVEDVPAA